MELGGLAEIELVVGFRVSAPPLEATALPLGHLQGHRRAFPSHWCALSGTVPTLKSTPASSQCSGQEKKHRLYPRWHRFSNSTPCGAWAMNPAQCFSQLWADFSARAQKQLDSPHWSLTQFIIGTLISKAYIKYSCFITHGATVSLHV